MEMYFRRYINLICFAADLIIDGENIKTIKYGYFSTKIMFLHITFYNV